MDDMLNSMMDKVKDVLRDDKNKMILAAAVGVYTLSKTDKERNAVIAGLLVYVLATLKEHKNA